MNIPHNKQWKFLEREDYANYLFVTNTWETYSTVLPKKWGFNPGRYLSAEYVDSACNLFLLKDFYDADNRLYFQYLFNKPQVWDKLHQVTIKNSDILFKLCRHVQRLDAKKLNNKQLLFWIDKFQKAQAWAHCPRGPMWLLETPDNLVTNYLYNYLQEKVSDSKFKISSNDAFQILVTPLKASIWSEEKKELGQLALIKSKKQQEKALIAHAKKYEWLEYGLQGKFLDIDYFRNNLQQILRQGAKKCLINLRAEIKNVQAKQKKIIKEYKIHPVHQKIFKIVQDSMFTRLYSKDAQFFGYYSMEPLFKEVAQRGYLTLEQVRFLTPLDFKKVLLQGYDASVITTTRQKYSLHIADKGKTVFYAGEEARRIKEKLNFYQENKKSISGSILRGQTAYQGKAIGRVKIINTIPEMAKMHTGNILVSHMTNPGIVPAMKKAVAIVTDQGGITCHAAIVARELKKPCVIGTKIATQVLKDGDDVEVDANKGIVKILK